MPEFLHVSTPRQIISAIIFGAWIVFTVYWIGASWTGNKAQKREPPLERILMCCGLRPRSFSCPKTICASDRSSAISAAPVVIASLGAALVVAGVLFAIWARWHLGKNWSAEVTIRKEHEPDPLGAVRAHPSPDLHRPAARDCGDGHRSERISRAGRGWRFS